MAEKLELADKWIQDGHRPGIVLRSVGVSRSTYYYRRLHKSKQERKHGGGRPLPGICYRVDGAIVSDGQVKEWLCELIEGEGYAYGYLKLTVCLRRKYGLVINKKKVYRLCKEVRLLRPQQKIKRKYPRDWQGTEKCWAKLVRAGRREIWLHTWRKAVLLRVVVGGLQSHRAFGDCGGRSRSIRACLVEQGIERQCVKAGVEDG
ncbi:MAG TPA: transposase [Firmicutes bacterium]|nr:transposase [Bacillota bacterium]